MLKQQTQRRLGDPAVTLPKSQNLTETRKWRLGNRKPDHFPPPDNVNPASASKTSYSARILDSANKSCSSRRRGRRRSLPNRQISTDMHAGNRKWQNSKPPVLLICVVFTYVSRRVSLRTQHAASCAYRRVRRRRRRRRQQQQTNKIYWRIDNPQKRKVS